ncbi:hypothetical protein SAMD00019534_090780 [Acytostelium subglobosum LB1]|uniref:hypothetical protein n=1 Tax=Acytostelium subglobosum LB1 TaxID=1410327 RepID=UPI0006449772|nr:hypothetical protein SAMD00019534_090780 [Acytostelium subglobosum LB1]GAM25903.1 hypothetical protein SAMD00019534_090780 [Acytostelium subglobosum LB1]|eukprot:XP_012750946.1 hypothetical protein SAMD00019534_090780 [Acytostelium subglobosum LB1]
MKSIATISKLRNINRLVVPYVNRSNTPLFVQSDSNKNLPTKRYIGITSTVEILSFGQLTPEKKEKRHTGGFIDTKVSQLLTEKAAGWQNIVKIREDETVFRAIQTMHKHRVGAVIVIDNENRMSGIFSERDYMKKIILRDLSSRTTLVKDVMSPHVATVSSDTSTAKCMSIMIKRGFRHLPVIEDNSLIGIVSIGDLVKHIISDQRSEIDHLKERLGGPMGI